MSISIYTTGQIAKVCGVSPQAIRKWIYEGKVEDTEIKDDYGRRIFTQRDLERFKNYAESRNSKDVKNNEQI